MNKRCRPRITSYMYINVAKYLGCMTTSEGGGEVKCVLVTSAKNLKLDNKFKMWK